MTFYKLYIYDLIRYTIMRMVRKCLQQNARSSEQILLSIKVQLCTHIDSAKYYRFCIAMILAVLITLSMGFCILLVQGVATLSRYMKTTKLKFKAPTWPFYLALVLVGILATRTVVRNGDWHTRESLLRYTCTFSSLSHQ